MRLKLVNIIVCGVLDALIRVMDLWIVAGSQCFVQSHQGQFLTQAAAGAWNSALELLCHGHLVAADLCSRCTSGYLGSTDWRDPGDWPPVLGFESSDLAAELLC